MSRKGRRWDLDRQVYLEEEQGGKRGLTRRELLKASLIGGGIGTALSLAGYPLLKRARYFLEKKETVFIASVKDYDKNIVGAVIDGFTELGVTPTQIKDKKILLKPNLVEPHAGAGHINTHPAVIRATIEAFFHFGAKTVSVGEGSGHRRDTYYCLEATGLGDVLKEDAILFVDLNNVEFFKTANLENQSRLGDLYLPRPLAEADIVVSMAKMKTHHWAGVTLSMKNLFGVMPGCVYGWPKNVLHYAGIVPSIIDINATVRPSFSIVDGIVGMEGDGPIMGTPIESGVLVLGRNSAAVDATCARLMGIDPTKVDYLYKASGRIGTIYEHNIEQRGESISSNQRNFHLLDYITSVRLDIK